ncbi:hypothetical protein BOX15_Mlig028193g1 [Macrostomum lignano]|uniref:DUF917 domain-containing protein n=2 Tax=Macrostomum lignano TaxID=282301 RepID=A0A267E5U7_9PLAT|nr:hypothetical protein BOX15_Mlig028193g3 [Macrostomum lignano]PAA56032.1 hypothetical protein BOX15_Mlig028193g1 [Macrostomum lignano]
MLRIGIDVGGTNTDAALLKAAENSTGRPAILRSVKTPTTDDVTGGVRQALREVLQIGSPDEVKEPVQLVSIGTTHLINAVLQRRGLAKICVVRLGRPSTAAVPPFSDWPEDLRQAVRCRWLLADGGYNYDGETVITEPNEAQIKEFARSTSAETGCRRFVVVGVFAPVRPDQELQAGRWIREAVPGASLTLSHQVAGSLGLLERENASVLNECLKPACARAIRAFQAAMTEVGLACPLVLTLSDGTVATAPDCLDRPVSMLGSGPTNSMRGAAFLTGLSDAIVADIGGTTTDIGLLVGGFPKPAAVRVRIAGVATNFTQPDVTSIALGGGSIVTAGLTGESPSVGPQSVGYKLIKEALVFGGNIPTVTDAAVASSPHDVQVGDADRLRARLADANEESQSLSRLLRAAYSIALTSLEAAVDAARVSSAQMPVVLVGGGAALFSGARSLAGMPVQVPADAGVANALGAGLCQVSGNVEATLNLADPAERKARLDEVKAAAVDAAVSRGSVRSSTQLKELHEVQLPYVPGGACRVSARAIGELDISAAARLSLQVNAHADGADASVLSEEESGTAAKQASRSTCVPVPAQREFDDQGDWLLSDYDTHCLSVGAGLIGCGGGGSPYVGRLMLNCLMENGHRPRIVKLDRMLELNGAEGLVALPGFVGSPTVCNEKITSGLETATAIRLVHLADELRRQKPEQQLHFVESCDALGGGEVKWDEKIVGVASLEIGGLNSIEPLVVAAKLGLPVLDMDGMGRAFPELQMVLPMIGGCPAAPAAIGDEFERGAVIVECDSAKELETHFRSVCVQRGCSVGIAMPPLKLQQCREHLLPGSYTRAWRLGDGILRARAAKTDPVETARSLLNGRVLLSRGKIADVRRVTSGGFARGSLIVVEDRRGESEESGLDVEFQNEYLLVKRLGAPETEALACTPDLIIVMDADSGEPVTTEELRYGLRVAVLAAPCHPRMATPAALAAVGPQAFGFDGIKYRPCAEYRLDADEA